MRENYRLGIRWTIGDVNPEGFETLNLSIRGMWRVFGRTARYKIFVNSISLDAARDRAGKLPTEVEWKLISRSEFPEFLRLDGNMAEGTGWKLCPLKAFNGLPELALDNDCILWSLPDPMRRWLDGTAECLIAEDVRAHFGCFSKYCGTEPRNSGIRGLWPSFPFEDALCGMMEGAESLLTEGDEQGLQVAALYSRSTPEVVALEDVSICSPFPPHSQRLGKCGAHFVGLNTRSFNWTYYGRDPVQVTREHWQKLRPMVEERVG